MKTLFTCLGLRTEDRTGSMAFISSCCYWFQEVTAGSMKIQPPRLYSGEVCCGGIRSESSGRAMVKESIDSRMTGGREALAINTACSTNFTSALLLHQSLYSVWTSAVMFMQDLLLSVHIEQVCSCVSKSGVSRKKCLAVTLQNALSSSLSYILSPFPQRMATLINLWILSAYSNWAEHQFHTLLLAPSDITSAKCWVRVLQSDIYCPLVFKEKTAVPETSTDFKPTYHRCPEESLTDWKWTQNCTDETRMSSAPKLLMYTN